MRVSVYVGRIVSYGYRMTKQFNLLYKVSVLSIFTSGVPASSSSSLSLACCPSLAENLQIEVVTMLHLCLIGHVRIHCSF